MKKYAIIYCIQVLLDSVYRDMYKIYIGNKIRNLTRFYDDSYYIASHKTSTIFWGYVKNTRSVAFSYNILMRMNVFHIGTVNHL